MGLLKVINNYRKLGHKEFMKRLNDGVAKVSQVQQAKSQLYAHPFILIGIGLGIYFTFKVGGETIFWLPLILFGSLWIEGLAFFGAYQKYVIMKKQQDIMNAAFELQDSSLGNLEQGRTETSFHSPVILKSVRGDEQLNKEGGDI